MLDKQKNRVTIVVLGDVARSPRMLYHALALAAGPAAVDLVGHVENPLPEAIRDHRQITCHRLPSPLLRRGQRSSRLLFLLNSICNVVGQSLQLLWCLLARVDQPDVILVQTPPAMPTLLVARIAARLRGAKLIIDWHNFGYSMLALRLGRHHPIVRLSRCYERVFGRCAEAHFCVSGAMQATLSTQWGIDAIVLYDRPGEQFTPTPQRLRRDVLQRLWARYALPPAFQPETPDRPAIIVSSTSWTADEDFALLLDTVIECDAMIRNRHVRPDGRSFPSLLILITGKGPRRDYYEKQIKALRLDKIHLHTLWLEAEDYPLLLGVADLGLCLHRSSSGLDIPMKVADMLGSGLPVCALDYGPCLHEVLQHGENGLLFSTSAQLAHLLYDLFRDFPHQTAQLNGLRHNIIASHQQRWTDEWNAQARPVFVKL